jgi:hypothetical protein
MGRTPVGPRSTRRGGLAATRVYEARRNSMNIFYIIGVVVVVLVVLGYFGLR